MFGSVTSNRLCHLLVQVHYSFFVLFDASNLWGRHQTRTSAKQPLPGQHQSVLHAENPDGLLWWRTGFLLPSVHLRVHLMLPVLQPARHLPVLNLCCQMTASLIWKSSPYLYVLPYAQKRFSAVGWLEIKLHREGKRAKIFSAFSLEANFSITSW